MRFIPSVAVVVAGLCGAVPVAAQQTVPAIRRAQPIAFPLSITPTAGIGFGSDRATAFDDQRCPSEELCLSLGSGSGWTVGAELQVPLGGSFGVEVAGHLARPTQRRCVRGLCEAPQDLWAIRGSALILWRFKARAPIYFGFGAAVTRFDPPPVSGQDLSSTLEYGAGTVVGYDFRFTPRLGGWITWRSYLLAPSSENLPSTFETKSVAWDNAFAFGLRIQMGS